MQIRQHKHYNITHKSFLQSGSWGPSSLILSSVSLDSFEPSVSPGWHNFSHFSLIMLHLLFCEGVKLKYNKTSSDILLCHNVRSCCTYLSLFQVRSCRRCLSNSIFKHVGRDIKQPVGAESSRPPLLWACSTRFSCLHAYMLHLWSVVR